MSILFVRPIGKNAQLILLFSITAGLGGTHVALLPVEVPFMRTCGFSDKRLCGEISRIFVMTGIEKLYDKIKKGAL